MNIWNRWFGRERADEHPQVDEVVESPKTPKRKEKEMATQLKYTARVSFIVDADKPEDAAVKLAALREIGEVSAVKSSGVREVKHDG